MPIYEYQCDQCNYHFERFQSFNDEPVRECPRCAGKVRRVLQPVGIVFKGSGFYITDNRQVGSGNSKRPKGKEEHKAEKATETKD